MELFGILLGLISWPVAIGVWLLFCRSQRISKKIFSIGLAVLIGLPLLSAFSLGHFMFLDEPLQIAAREGSIKQAEHSLQLGAFVNAYSEMGSNPLMDAVRAENIPMVKLLLAHGANVNAREDRESDDKHQTILQLAQHTHNKTLINLIQSAGAKR